MATLNTSGSNVNEGLEQYPYPSHVNAASFMSIELSGEDDYARWKAQMLCLVDSHDMLGFIDGTLEKPQESSGSKSKTSLATFEAKYREWKRSDTLVKGWIFGSTNKDVMGIVLGLETATEVWNELKKNYEQDPTSTTTETATSEKKYEDYVPLCRAIQRGDWKKAEEFFNEDEDALTGKLNVDENSSLHIAIGNLKNIGFVEKLLERIQTDCLPSLLNDRKQNPLHYAALLDNPLAAEKLVEKNPYLLFMIDLDNSLPIEIAISNSHKATFIYLLQACKQYIKHSQEEGYYNPFEGETGAYILNGTITSGFLDVSCNLLKDYPELARTKATDNPAPLECIAKKRDAYKSAKRYNFYQSFVYYHIPENFDLDEIHNIQDVENQETYRMNLVTSTQKPLYSVIKRIYVKLWKAAIQLVPHIKRIQEDKMQHKTALKLLKFVCEEVVKLKSSHAEHYEDAFVEAVKNDTPEVLRQITETFPQAIWCTKDKCFISQLSIMNRCEEAYNFLVHEVTHDKHLHRRLVDNDGNNLLHLAGKLAPANKLDMVTGAALQMQRELQWFQEVSKFIRPKEKEALNNQDETPMMVFRKAHKDLRKDGEEWMKKTADSYTITAALIITIVFAAAITVPGGNNGDTGKAIFETNLGFIVFVVSDSISLFTSTTSLLLFLSILTARYAEEDFLYKLPKRLILGLVMLFISVTSMMLAFSATLYISFGQGKSWILIPVGVLTCLPIASFVTLQLPLLVDLYFSTYSHGIFGKRSELETTP